MEAQLLELLDYQPVLAALASTRDGLLVASVGLAHEDAEAVAAAGSAVAAGDADPVMTIALKGGDLYVALGQELMLLALAETDTVGEGLAGVMLEKVGILDSLLAGEG
ncbi:MAG TPA: hypothetical protein VFI42_17785 [Thermomicrobiaceae bacterium]|nr:hypothetical protein [Thermomicrobiaceae bacterium]